MKYNIVNLCTFAFHTINGFTLIPSYLFSQRLDGIATERIVSMTEKQFLMNKYSKISLSRFSDNEGFINNSTNTDTPIHIDADDSSRLIEDGYCYDLCDTEIISHSFDNSDYSEQNSSLSLPATDNLDHVTVPTPNHKDVHAISSSTNNSDEKLAQQNQTLQPTNMANQKQHQIPSKEEAHKNMIQKMKNLELRWNIDASNEDCDLEDLFSCSEPCYTCRGTGIVECKFCQGVGYLEFGAPEKGTMGERLVNMNSGRTGVECPICNEDGEQSCSNCMGAGWIAKWRLMNDTFLDLKP